MFHKIGTNYPDPTQKSHARPQALGFRNGGPVFDVRKPGIGGKLLQGQTAIHKPAISQFREVLEETAKAHTSPGAPMSASAHGKVLRFFAYFKEGVPESPLEHYRVHKVVIYFYLDDDTLHIEEPRLDNAGMDQGRLLRRTRVPKPEGEGVYTAFDLNIGVEPEVFGRKYHIYNVDPFTKDFLGRIGVEVPEAEPDPKDPYEDTRTGGKHFMKKIVAQPRVGQDKLKRFLESDGKVLRFFCTWDDPGNVVSERRHFALHFYLADDTMEIVERPAPNAPRDIFPRFMHRQRLPKPEAAEGGLKDYYVEKDLIVGRTISIFGREFFIFDCDDTTREFFVKTFGHEQASLPPPETEPAYVPPEPEIPPPTGFGGDEDSLSCWRSLVPKPPKRDQQKLIMNEGKVMRFGGQLASDSPIDRERKFVLSYFLADDTISVFEPPQRNSGVPGGSFLRRSRVKVPGAEPTNPPLYYKTSDFGIGKIIVIHMRKFTLVDADDYALHYMELHPEDFPDSDINKVHQELKGIIEAKGLNMREVFEAGDVNDDGTMNGAEFNGLLAKFGLSPQAALTLFRRYDIDNDGKISLNEFLSAIE